MFLYNGLSTTVLGLTILLGQLGFRFLELGKIYLHRLTKGPIGSWLERMTSHVGTETQPRLLREAAVRNFPQWAKK